MTNLVTVSSYPVPAFHLFNFADAKIRFLFVDRRGENVLYTHKLYLLNYEQIVKTLLFYWYQLILSKLKWLPDYITYYSHCFSSSTGWNFRSRSTWMGTRLFSMRQLLLRSCFLWNTGLIAQPLCKGLCDIESFISV